MQILENIEASILKFCNDLNTELVLGCKVFNFDTHATVNELPQDELIGLMGLDLLNSGGLIEGSCMIAVCTLNDDTDLSKLRKAISSVFDRLQPGVQLDNVVSTTGSPIGKLTIMEPVHLMKVGSAKSRPIQMISFQFGSALHSLQD